jgi:hypothetical protein
VALIICAWQWGNKYGPEYAERLKRGFAKHCPEPHRFEVVKPYAEDENLTNIQGCFARLRMFDPQWQDDYGIVEGDRVVCVDLDAIVTGDLFPLFHRAEDFIILQGANAANPCPYNGSLWLLRAGYRPDVWTDFTPDAARRVPFYKFPEDQAWLAHKLPNANGWISGASSGVYAFKKPGWPEGDGLPKDARFVCFPGSRDPSQFTHLDWVKRHWLDA